MDISTAFLVSAGVYALLTFVLIPLSTAEWNANRSISKIGKAGWMAGFALAQKVFLVAAIAYFIMTLLYLFIGTRTHGSPAQLASAYAHVLAVQAVVQTVSDRWSAFYVVVILVMLGVVYATSTRQLQTNLRELFRAKIRSLAAHRNRDPKAWTEAATPSAEMDVLAWQIRDTKAKLNQLDEHTEVSPLQLAQRRDYLQTLLTNLIEQWNVHDFENHLTFTWPPEETSASNSLVRRFTSKGWLSDIRGFSKVASYVLLASTFAVLIGINSSDLSGILIQRKLQISDLSVKLNKANAEKSFQKLLADSDGQKLTLTEEDNRILHSLSELFARAFSNNSAWQYPHLSRPLGSILSQDLVREQVLTKFAHSSDREPTLTAVKTISDAASIKDPVPHLSLLGRQEISNFAADKPDSLGLHFQSDFEAVLRAKGPTFWNEVKKRLLQHAALYNEPFDPDDLNSEVVGQVFGSILDGIKFNDNNEISKLVASFIQQAGKGTLQKAYDLAFKRFMLDLAGNASLTDALNNVGGRNRRFPILADNEVATVTEAFKTLPDTADIKEFLTDNPPSLEAEWEAHGVNIADAEQDVKTIRDLAGGLLTEDPTLGFASLQTYDDNFPSRLGINQFTPKGRLSQLQIAEENQREGGKPSSQIAEVLQEEETYNRSLFDASRDIEELRASPHVGGILLGSNITSQGTVSRWFNPAADVTDASWNFQDSNITLILDTKAGQVVLGPYPDTLARLALAFAADGRPTAVTRLNDKLVRRQRVLLHPALVDTVFGGRLIRADDWVFQYAARDSDEQRAEAQVLLYQSAWFARTLLILSEHAVDQAVASSSKDPKALALCDDQARNSLPLRPLENLRSNAESAVWSMKTVFDRELVKSMESCGSEHPNGTDFCSCIQTEFSSKVADGTTETLRGWLADLPPEPNVVSQIRERDFMNDQHLSFLIAPAGNDLATRLWPFTFGIEMTLGHRQSWEFPRLTPSITSDVDRGLSRSGQGPVLEEMRKFVVMTRLFRQAFDGRLGAHFPLQKLPGLMAELTTRVGSSDRSYTPRWLPTGGFPPDGAGKLGEEVRVLRSHLGIDTDDEFLKTDGGHNYVLKGTVAYRQ